MAETFFLKKGKIRPVAHLPDVEQIIGLYGVITYCHDKEETLGVDHEMLGQVGFCFITGYPPTVLYL